MKKTLLLIVFSLLFFGMYAQEDCGCEILPEDIPVCVEIEEGIVLPLPNECFAECWGFGPDSYVDCGEIDPFPSDSTWVDCDCEIDPEEEFICVLTDVELNLVCQFPNLCFAECLGYSEADVVDCGEYDDGEWPGDYGDPCDCEIDPEAEWICVEVEEGFVMPFPSLCFAECEGFTAENVVECDDNDWPGEPDPCDCEIDPEAEWICVEVEDGFVIPFPNLCFAECEGFTETDVVECDEIGWPQDSTWTDPCDCEILPSDEPVCVEIDGEICELPNQCFADCFELETVDCDDEYTGGSPTTGNLQNFNGNVEAGSTANTNGKIQIQSIFPNPITGNEISIEILLDSKDNSNTEVKILDLYGNILTTSNLVLQNGLNKVNLSANNLPKGILFVNVISEGKVTSQRIIKQ